MFGKIILMTYKSKLLPINLHASRKWGHWHNTATEKKKKNFANWQQLSSCRLGVDELSAAKDKFYSSKVFQIAREGKANKHIYCEP